MPASCKRESALTLRWSRPNNDALPCLLSAGPCVCGSEVNTLTRKYEHLRKRASGGDTGGTFDLQWKPAWSIHLTCHAVDVNVDTCASLPLASLHLADLT